MAATDVALVRQEEPVVLSGRAKAFLWFIILQALSIVGLQVRLNARATRATALMPAGSRPFLTSETGRRSRKAAWART